MSRGLLLAPYLGHDRFRLSRNPKVDGEVPFQEKRTPFYAMEEEKVATAVNDTGFCCSQAAALVPNVMEQNPALMAGFFDPRKLEDDFSKVEDMCFDQKRKNGLGKKFFFLCFKQSRSSAGGYVVNENRGVGGSIPSGPVLFLVEVLD